MLTTLVERSSLADESKTSDDVGFDETKQRNTISTAIADDRQISELTWRSGLATAGAACSYFVTVGFLNAFGVFQEYYTSTLLHGYSDFQISWLGSFALFAFFAGAPAAGILSDKYGPTTPIACGSVTVLFAIFMISLCKKYYQFFLAQGMVLGLGMAFIGIPASGMVPRYFARHRALATGISIGGSSLGGIIWPIIFDRLFHHDGVSFGWSLRIAGFIQIPLLAFIILSVRLPVPKPSSQDGMTSEKGAATKAEHKSKGIAALKSPAFILVCSGLFLGYLGFFSPFFYISTYAVHLGESTTLAFYLVSIVNGASLVGRILPGMLADRYGRWNLLMCSAFLAGVCAFCWTAATSIPGVVVWSVAYGFSSGAILSLQLACATSLAPPESASSLIGITMGSVSLSGLFGTPINGAILGRGGYIGLSCFSGGMLIICSGFILAARLSLNKKLIAVV
ncbi:MFS monocarboxylate transporter [Acrodontium crateriforme]|uniref:MFS monocarboxylate transporter n=1 Tax=Acrodontium crateriforme TaxID=150365 RepID=A0AAQ3M024_9PEZI|nr:MFS monocarboxylate transporter [Acrodontium crateriforme]